MRLGSPEVVSTVTWSTVADNVLPFTAKNVVISSQIGGSKTLSIKFKTVLENKSSDVGGGVEANALGVGGGGINAHKMKAGGQRVVYVCTKCFQSVSL